MANYEADCEDLSDDEFLCHDPAFALNDSTNSLLDINLDRNAPNDCTLETTSPPEHLSAPFANNVYDDDPAAFSDDSEYSLDYEYLGPRNPNYRPSDVADSDASELSDVDPLDNHRESTAGFDMWDEDPYSTNDYTWESNDMRLTWFIKARRNQLNRLNAVAPWRHDVFWRKERGWPRQLPTSCSTTNHDQSANALCLVLGDYGLGEQLFAIYRNRILECGQSCELDSMGDPLSTLSQISPSIPHLSATTSSNRVRHNDPLTWIDSDQRPFSRSRSGLAILTTTTQPNSDGTGGIDHSKNSRAGSSFMYAATAGSYGCTGGTEDSSTGSSTSTTGSKFCETHLSVSLRRPSLSPDSTSVPVYPGTKTLLSAATASYAPDSGIISKFIPYTKFIRRSDFLPVSRQDSYLALDFEPLCLAQKYGYMAIGGLEGEFELYCCMDRGHPPQKVWGTKFKSKKNVQIMTNSVQIVRWQSLEDPKEYEHMLAICMNDAGILVYKLPSHRECINVYRRSSISQTPQIVQLYTHLRNFGGMPINDAKISHDLKQMVCVGDDCYLFLFDIVRDRSGAISFRNQCKLAVPVHLLQETLSGTQASEISYSSQYVAWSQSSRFFAHTSDTHNKVLVWNAATQRVQYAIDAAGYTYGIAFHPRLEGVLAFTNRYGYFHTVNLEEAYDLSSNTQKVENLLSESSSASSLSDHPANCTTHLTPHQEITMISFRGERDRRLRILAKINGIQWSRDGKFLYVATKKRVLAYEFLRMSHHISSLLEITSNHAREIFERIGATAIDSASQQTAASCPFPRKRKRENDCRGRVAGNKDRIRTSDWFEKWSMIPCHLRDKVLHETNLANHW
ncbi:hypothetical protein BX666DRAFT_1935523 [Dichotomocladium elegans]|nr:hypothetical protein BX666DRAFT_1935523 [Dichotomocladium elegans]